MRRVLSVYLLALCFVSSGCGTLFPVDWDAMKQSDKQPDKKTDDSKPGETFGLDKSIPESLADREAALALAELAREYADQLEYDGKKDAPLVTTTADVGRKFKLLNEYAWKGVNKAATRDFKKVTADVVKRELEPDDKPQPLDEDRRKTAVEIFRAIEYGCRQVK